MSNSTSFNSSQIKTWLCAVLLFFLFRPKWVWNWPDSFTVIFCLMLAILSFEDIRKNKGIMGLVAWLFQFFVLSLFYVSSSSNIIGYIGLFLFWFGFSTVFLCSSELLKKTSDCLLLLLAFLLVPALIEHVFVQFLNLPFSSPSTSECPFNPDRPYYVYMFNVYTQELVPFDYRRFYAFFDEPGVMGTVSFIILYCQRFDLKKWYNIVFLVCGLLSFSLAFYFAMIFWYLFFGNIKVRLAFVLVAIIALYFLYSNDFLYDVIFSRFEVADGKMVGYDRENLDFAYWYEKHPLNEYILWGYRPVEKIPYAASWKWAIAILGVLPTILYMVLFSCVREKNINRKNFFIAICAMLFVFIQRPFIQHYLYVYLMMLPFVYYSIDGKKRVG